MGFGKVVGSGTEEEVFVHFSKSADPARRYLVEGEPIEYEAEPGERGLAAATLLVIECRATKVDSGGTNARLARTPEFGFPAEEEPPTTTAPSPDPTNTTSAGDCSENKPVQGR
jgi:cold shock CspA family protein